jgi:hypothetical protein
MNHCISRSHLMNWMPIVVIADDFLPFSTATPIGEEEPPSKSEVSRRYPFSKLSVSQ